MEISQLITELETSHREPDDVIRDLIARKEESTPALLEVVASVFNNYKVQAVNREDFIHALYILSYFREPLAFPFVIELALIPADWIEKVLGEHIFEGLSSWFVSTYNGDLDAIKGVIENETAFLYARSAALESLLGLFSLGTLTREDCIAYFKQVLRSEVVKDYEFTAFVVGAATKIHPEELYSDIMDLFDRNMIFERHIDKKSVDKALKMDKDLCLQKYIYECKYFLPITDVFDRI